MRKSVPTCAVGMQTATGDEGRTHRSRQRTWKRCSPARAKSQRFSGGQYEESRAATGCRKVSNLVNGERPGVRIAHAPLRR
jgi:hypothetical protein